MCEGNCRLLNSSRRYCNIFVGASSSFFKFFHQLYHFWGDTLRAHLDQVPLNYPSETVVQPSSTAHFHYGFPTVEPLSWYGNKLLSSNLKTAIFQPCKRCHTP